jgi:hypothetical protein
MSKINFNGPVNITGSHAQIGDNHHYSSSADFYKATPTIQYTDTERELVDLIYSEAPTEKERQDILASLKAIKENETSDGAEETIQQNSSRIIDFLKAIGTDTAAKIIVELGAHLLKGMS